MSATLEAVDARPWAACTGAGDCPEVWHVHGCYADQGQCDDPLDHDREAATDPVTALQSAVRWLERTLPELVEQCTSPDASDMATLLADVRTAREALAGMERDLETQLGRAMLADYLETAGLRVERSRSSDRKAWDHDSWRRDVRQQLLRKHGLLGAQGIVTADGEVADAKALGALLSELFDVQGKKEPTTTGLRALGLDARDYCETTPGAVRVRITRLADETKED